MTLKSPLPLTLIALSVAAAQPTTLPEKNPATAADTVRYFLELMKSGDVATASKLSEGISPADLKQGADQIGSGKTAVTVIDSREDADLAIVILKLVEDGKPQFTAGPLLKRSGRWTLARDPQANLDAPGQQRLQALQKWSDDRCQELQKALPTTRP